MTSTATAAPSAKKPTEQPVLQWLPLGACRVTQYNSRADLGADFPELVASIRLHGIQQPVLAHPLPPDDSQGHRWEIIAGKRRYSAALEAELETIPALIQPSTQTPQLIVEQMLIENLQRRSFNPIEEAHGYRWLSNQNYTEEQIAERVEVSRRCVQGRLALLDLPAADQDALQQQTLGVKTAEKRARVHRWIQASRRQIESDPGGSIIAALDPEASREYFDDLTGEVHYSQPYVALDTRPAAHELQPALPAAARRKTWRDLTEGSDSGVGLRVIRCVSPQWEKVELADAQAVYTYVRANHPGHLRRVPTNLNFAAKELARHQHQIWDHAAGAALGAIEAADAAHDPRAPLRLAAICALDRQDLEFFAKRLRLDPDARRSADTAQLRQLVLENLPMPTATLLLSCLLLLAARRDLAKHPQLPLHPAAAPLLDYIGADPNQLTTAAENALLDALNKRHTNK